MHTYIYIINKKNETPEVNKSELNNTSTKTQTFYF